MIYTFKLYRRVCNPSTGGMIISAFNLDRECADPFRERMKLCREFPRWAIGSDFASPVDEEYEAFVDSKHVCGLQGYDPSIDPPCPGCVELGRVHAENNEHARVEDSWANLPHDDDDLTNSN